MTLRTKLDQLLANDKLGEALDLLMDNNQIADKDTYNTLILLKSRNTSNEKDNNLGIVARDEYKRSKAQITYAFQQTVEKVSTAILSSEIGENNNQTSNSNMSNQKEIQGFQSLLDLVIEKRIFLEKELLTAYDGEKKFAIFQQIKTLEEQINSLKQKVSDEVQKVSTSTVNIGNNSTGNFVLQNISGSNLSIEIKNGLIEMGNKIEKELLDLKEIDKKLVNSNDLKLNNEDIELIYTFLEKGDIEKAISNLLEITRKTTFYDMILAINVSFKAYSKNRITGLNVSGKIEEITIRLSEILQNIEKRNN